MDWSHAVRIMGAMFLFLLWCPIATCNIYYGYRRYRDPNTDIPSPFPIIGSVLGIAMLLVPPYLSVLVRVVLVLIVLILSDGSWYAGVALGRRASLKSVL
jgi:uncharacterized membrane protein